MASTREREPETVDVAGPDDATPIVFVHGTIFNRTMWAPQRDALSTEYRVLTPELPGHGTRADEPFRLETAVESLEATVDTLVDEPVHLVGLSLGGYVATEFARRRPGAVETLVLSGSSANPVGFLGKVTHVLGRIGLRAAESGLVERATNWLAERYVRSRDLGPETTAEILEAGFDLRPFGEAGIEIAGEDFRAALASFPGPTLVLNGKWDLVMRLGEEDHASAAQDASVWVVDGASHACNLDQPDAYTERLGRFIESTVTVSKTD